jgi:hypothetical protein
MNIEIIKGSDNSVSEFFSSPSNTPEIDEVEKYSGVTIKDSVTTCGDESSSVYIPVIFARNLERERDEAIKLLKYSSTYSTTKAQEDTYKFLRKINKWKDTK